MDEDREPGAPDPADVLAVTVADAGDGVQVRLTGELDAHTAPLVEAMFAALRNLPVGRRVGLDLSPLTFIDSSGLRVLLLGRTEAAGAGLDVTVDGSNSAIDRLLQITGVGDILRGSAGAGTDLS